MASIIFCLGIAVLIVLFIVVTDGRYFGKKLMYWVYDRLGPHIYGGHSEVDRWRKVIKAVGIQGDEVILDVGTATGELPLTIAAMPGFHGRIIGIDQSPRMIVRAEAEATRHGLSPLVEFRVLDARKPLPFSNYAFDVVFCIGLLETLPHPELILRELQRVIRPKGTLVLSYYRGWPSLSLRWYQRQLRTFGFDTLRITHFRIIEDILVNKQVKK